MGVGHGWQKFISGNSARPCVCSYLNTLVRMFLFGFKESKAVEKGDLP